DPHLQVLCACAPGQVSQMAESVRQSAFGYYLKQGLGGAADGYNADGRRNRRVSVMELAEFVTARVDRWARDRNARQTPVLLGKGKDFELTRYDTLPAAPAVEPLAYPFADAWAIRDQWLANDYRFLPWQFRQLQAHLLRAEQRWAGGVEVK